MLNIPLEDENNNDENNDNDNDDNNKKNKDNNSSFSIGRFIKSVIHVIRVIFKKRVIHPHVVTLTHFKQLSKPLPSTYGSAPPDRIRYGSLPSDQLSFLSLVYVLISFFFTTLFGIRLLLTHTTLSFNQLLIQVLLCIYSLTCIGLLTEKNIKYSGIFESLRVFGMTVILLIHSSFPTLQSCYGYISYSFSIQFISTWNDTMKYACQYQHGYNLKTYFMLPVVLSKEVCFLAAWLIVMVWTYIYRTEFSSQGNKYQKIKEIWKFAHPDDKTNIHQHTKQN